MVTLKNRHLIINKNIIENLFANAAQVCWVFYATKNTLLIASQHDDLFKSLHKTSMSMLKFKNSIGDRSISVEELLLDNEIDASERILNFTADNSMKILTITF